MSEQCRPGQPCPDQGDDHVHCHHRGQCCHCACPGDGRSHRDGTERQPGAAS